MKQKQKFFFSKENILSMEETLDMKKMANITGGNGVLSLAAAPYSRETVPPTYTESTYVRK